MDQQRVWNRREILRAAGAFGVMAGSTVSGLLAGCGGGGSGDDSQKGPVTRLALFPNGGVWRSRIYPNATQETFIWTDIFYFTPGSNRLHDYNVGGGAVKGFNIPNIETLDTDLPGVLIRVNQVTPFNVQLPITASYGGTFRQDTATGDLFLLRLPGGELLDTPAKILPGSWSSNTAFTSPFLVGGQEKGSYSLTVTGTELLSPDPTFEQYERRTWKTTVVSSGALSDLSGTFWYAPDVANYTQAIPAGVASIDRKLQNYLIYESE
jgi:hypothetical protein